MTKSPLELDFFSTHREKKPLDRRCSSSFKGIQNAISKIDPQVLKSVIGSGPPSYRDAAAADENASVTAPLTIFYNGRVAVYDVPRDTAEKIIQHAVEENTAAVSASSSTSSSAGQLLEEETNGDMRMARKHSLQRFLEKRKDRYQAA